MWQPTGAVLGGQCPRQAAADIEERRKMTAEYRVTPRCIMSSVLFLSGMGLNGCLLPADEAWKMNELAHRINDGRGAQRPLVFGKDHFALLLEMLGHRREDVRISVANSLRTDAAWSGANYVMLADAYCDGKRARDLMEALWQAWQKAPPGSEERYWMAAAFIDCRCFQYLSEHPVAAEAVRMWRHSDNGYIGTLTRKHWIYLVPKVADEGDVRIVQVWEDYLRLSKLLRRWFAPSG